MNSLLVASINAEWMNNWFTADGEPAAFEPTFRMPGETGNSPPHDTQRTAMRLAREIKAIDADILALQEAPSRKEELDLFIEAHLSAPGGPIYASILGDSGRSQKLALLFKRSVVSATLAPASSVSTLLEPWEADVDGSLMLASYEFTRTPLIVNVDCGNDSFQLIVMHTKSAYVNRGQEKWRDPARRQEYIFEAVRARRRTGAEAMRTREYLEEQLSANPDARVIVLGDLNDGPGLDFFERHYLLHNITDILVGSAYQPEHIFAHAQHDVARDRRFTAEFDDFVTDEKNKKLLLDHILLSPAFKSSRGLRKVPGSGRIHHEEFLAQIDNGGARREDRPSDHRPVSVTVEFDD